MTCFQFKNTFFHGGNVLKAVSWPDDTKRCEVGIHPWAGGAHTNGPVFNQDPSAQRLQQVMGRKELVTESWHDLQLREKEMEVRERFAVPASSHYLMWEKH